MDLATTVSKYIGETEKNLDRIFGAAEGSNAILFFDEADALFGKRSEVGDSHDRYANIEVAYLLQKMEGYPGAVILATNFRRNIDDAFVRRLDFVIDFPFPEKEDRRRIWDKVLPPEAPLADDIDLDFLSEKFKLSRRRDPQLLAVRRVPGRRRGLADRHAAPGPRRRERVRQAGPAHAGGRLREVPRRHQGRRTRQRRLARRVTQAASRSSGPSTSSTAVGSESPLRETATSFAPAAPGTADAGGCQARAISAMSNARRSCHLTEPTKPIRSGSGASPPTRSTSMLWSRFHHEPDVTGAAEALRACRIAEEPLERLADDRFDGAAAIGRPIALDTSNHEVTAAA